MVDSRKVHRKTKADHGFLCLAEKLKLMKYFNDIPLQNKTIVFINHSRHQTKLLLKSLERNIIMHLHSLQTLAYILIPFLLYFVFGSDIVLFFFGLQDNLST